MNPPEYLTRSAWGARLDLGPPMRLPAVGVHVHHSVTIVDDDGMYHATADVAADMREIERIGAERFGRFPYSYCGHPSGWVGVGAATTVGAHTAGHNSTSLGYCLIGNYDIAAPTRAQLDAFARWRAHMVARGRLTAGHWVEPHQARKATACPGRHTMAVWDQLTGRIPPSEEPPMLTIDQVKLAVLDSVNLLFTDPARVPDTARDYVARFRRQHMGLTVGTVQRALRDPAKVAKAKRVDGVDGALRDDLREYLDDWAKGARERGVI